MLECITDSGQALPTRYHQLCRLAVYRFNLSHRRDAGPPIEDLPAERVITVSRELIRLWRAITWQRGVEQVGLFGAFW